jgi:hypothetical protein
MRIPVTPEDFKKFNEEYDNRKIKARDYQRSRKKNHLGIKLKKYDITKEQYDEMFNKQQGKCHICDKHQSELLRPLCIDHSHKTNKVRGLLCDRCNRGLGVFQDDVKLLLKAIEYLS